LWWRSEDLKFRDVVVPRLTYMSYYDPLDLSLAGSEKELLGHFEILFVYSFV
jgi:hypothetical protein